MAAPRLVVPLAVGLGLGLLAAVLVATPDPVSPLAADDAAGGAADDAPAQDAPRNAFNFHHEHRFLDEDARMTFEVPEHPRPGRVAIWFEGVHAAGGASIRILAPDGSILMESALGSTIYVFVGGGINGREQTGPLAPGTYTVEFAGESTATGHALAESL